MDVPEEKLDDLPAEPLPDKHTPVPNPFQRGTAACIGTESCSPVLAETKARTARMLWRLRDNTDVFNDVSQPKIHYFGYTADCGQTNMTNIGLFDVRAQRDGEMVEVVDIGIGGGIGEEPSFVDWVQQRVPVDEVLGAIASLVEVFAERRDPGQTFREWVDTEETETVTKYYVPGETEFEVPYTRDAKQSWYPSAEDETQPEQAVMSD